MKKLIIKEPDMLNPLIDIHTQWCEANNLEPLSADDMLHIDGITEEQTDWLIEFIDAWEKAEDLGRYYYNLKKENK